MQKNYIFEDFFSGFLTGFCYDYTKFTIQKFTASFMQKFRPPGNNFKAGGGEEVGRQAASRLWWLAARLFT